MPPCRGQRERLLNARTRKAQTKAERTPPFSKHQLNQACSNAVAQDSDPLKAQLFGKQTLSNAASSDADRTFAARFGRSRFEAGSKGQPCSSPWQSSLPAKAVSKAVSKSKRVFKARVRCASSRGVFESRGEFVRIASLFERARRTRTRKKERRSRSDFKEVEFAGSGALRSVLLIGARRIKKSDSPVGG